MRSVAKILCIGILFLSLRPRETSWVALGDSITYLNDHLNETGNRITKGYMTLVAEQYTGIHYTNQGHNGWTAVRIANEIEKLGMARADVYTVFLGTNDWWHGEPLGEWTDYRNATGNKTVYGAFRTIVDKLRSLNPQARIILITPMQRADFVYINDAKNNAYGSYRDKNGQRLEQFADAVGRIAQEEHFKWVDLYHRKELAMKNLVAYKRLKDPQRAGVYRNFPYPDFIDVPFHPETDEYPYPPGSGGMTYDGLHPSDEGYKVIAHLVMQAIKHAHLDL